MAGTFEEVLKASMQDAAQMTIPVYVSQIEELQRERTELMKDGGLYAHMLPEERFMRVDQANARIAELLQRMGWRMFTAYKAGVETVSLADSTPDTHALDDLFQFAAENEGG